MPVDPGVAVQVNPEKPPPAPSIAQPGRSPQGPAAQSSGLLVPGNINLNKRPIVHNADGSYSTVRSITITDDQGRAILIPTVVGKRVVSNEQAVRHYKRTGQHLGIFDSEVDADAYAQTLHDAQAAQYGARAGLPSGPPHPALLAVGFSGSIQDFNDRLDAVAHAHNAATGTRPTPGLALDLVRSPVPTGAFGPMLAATPKTQLQAKARATLATEAPLGTPGFTTHPNPDREQAELLAKALDNVRTPDELHAFLDPSNHAMIDAALDGPDTRIVQAAYVKAQSRIAKVHQTLAEQGLVGNPGGVLNKVVSEGALAGEQIATGLVLGPPTLAIAEGRAVAKAFEDGSLRPIGATNVKIAKGVVKGVKRDFAHPAENPGNLFLDALGLVSVGAGAVARLSAAGRALGEEGGGAALKAAARRPVGGTATLNKGSFAEEQLLTENPALRWAQKKLVNARNVRMAERDDQPGALLSIVRPQKVQDAIDLALDPLKANFSSENKLGREAKAARRIEQTIQMTVKRDLDQVAGWTQTAATAFQRINKTASIKGLTVGEQKAIQVLATDDPAPFAAWRQFHRNMIDLEVGDPAAHRAQLAAIKLAEKVIANPRPRFVKALELTRQVVEEQQRIKIDELGLKAETAGRRVVGLGEYVRQAGEAGTKGELASIPKPGELGGIPSKTEDAFYLPSIPKGKPRRATSERLESFAPQAGIGGIPLPSMPSELQHEFTGSSIRAGDFRIDATSLAGETFARTVKAATKLNEWRRLWDAGTDKPRNARFDRPVRDIKDFPEELRGIVNKALDAELTGEEALSLHPADIQDLERFLFPGELINGRWRLDQAIEHVKWVDSRLLDKYHQPLPGAFRTTFQLLNEPFRDFALFLRPAYILNLVGNVGMGLIHQGVLLPPNILRALRADSLYGEKVAKTLDALGGASGRSASYAPANLGEGIGKIATTPGRVLAGAWNTITDQHLRRAAIIHELRRQLVDLKKDPNDLDAILFDPELAKARNEGVRRGNKAMVEFDNQTWLEREALRHLVFVYPWQSRALVWSIRSIIEHPAQAALLDQIGQQAEDEFPEVLKKVPEWFKQIGYVPLGTNADGSPKVVNPSSVNTFSTFSQLLYPLEAGFTSSKYSSLSDLFGPGATFLVHGATGKDQFGNTYPDGQWLGAAKEVWGQLPQLRAGKQKTGQPLKGLNLADRNTLVTQLNSGLKQTVFTPGWLNGYGGLIAGGLTPRGVNPEALEARWYRDLDFAARHKVEMGLINRALSLQADLVKQKLPDGVKEAVALSGDRQVAYDGLKTQLGRTPTAKEKLGADISLFESKAKLNETDAALLQSKLAKITDPTGLDRFRAGLYDKYANAKDLQTWDEHVRFVFSFRPAVLAPKLAALKKQGLIASTALPKDQETLYAWGRKALAFYAEAKKRAKAVADTTYTLPAERSAAEADLRLWADQHDKPVITNGHAFPSPVRMTWANSTPTEQAAHLRSASTGAWSTLTNFDKTLLGVKADPVAAEAWATLNHWVADAEAKLPVGSHLPNGTRAYWADVLAKRAPAFRADLRLSRQILADRLPRLTPVKSSPNVKLWTQLLGAASERYKQLIRAGWSKTQAKDQWRRNDVPQLQTWIGTHPAFAKEVAGYGPEFLSSLFR